uniref:Uncharacterized protein n=1 Tax=Candidatus Kentrum sp. UNK TaxID=2126344 RepID=A0A450ZWL8_9GAMM|nr:MAG: hypothetical protein BECKUNK1418G_GA0071005_100241 [Candidatus Kentron sp. UNK]VFK68307.1 MAG: hypothetical protein BECKUNK1418H_GA0071006_100141 [Candidatus Kentron sp. UNK]
MPKVLKKKAFVVLQPIKVYQVYYMPDETIMLFENDTKVDVLLKHDCIRAFEPPKKDTAAPDAADSANDASGVDKAADGAD